MALGERAAATLTSLRTRVRREVDDPATHRVTGTAIPDGQRRYSDAEVTEAIQDTIAEMEVEASHRDPRFGARFVDVDISGELTDLPSDILGESVFHIEDVRNPELPFEIEIMDSRERAAHWVGGPISGLRVTLERQTPSGSTGHPNWTMRLHPARAEATTFRIWYLQAPTIPGVDADAHTLTVRFQQLIGLEAAFILLSRDEGMQSQQMIRLGKLRETFKEMRLARRSGRVRRARRALT
jgi:hypothetical protein